MIKDSSTSHTTNAESSQLFSSGVYVVATPIGNLADFSPRAQAVLRQVDCILCEDTRSSRVLLQHWEVHTKLESYHRFNEQAKLEGIVARLQAGAKIAIISDAGAPGIADPGTRLLDYCHQHAIAVHCVAGPSAVICAAMTSGMVEQGFIFAGFTPPKASARKRFLELHLRNDQQLPVIIFETPRRILSLLDNLQTLLDPSHRILLARELTKRHETIHRTTLAELTAFVSSDRQQQKGEIVLVIDPIEQKKQQQMLTNAIHLLKHHQLSASDASDLLSLCTGVSKRHCYKQYIEVTTPHD